MSDGWWQATATAAGVEYAHDRVRDAILSGRLQAGQPIPQITLAKTLHVSRTPLREALRLLQAEGLIEAQANHPMRVASLSLKAVEELYVMRIPLEVAALRLSIDHLTEADIAGLESLYAVMGRLAAQRDYDGWDGPHRRFHRALTRHAGDRFSLMISQLIDQCSRFRRMRVKRMWSDETELEHRVLLDACIARDVDRAVWQLTEHLSETAVALLRTVDADYPAEQLLAVIGQVERPSDAPARAYHTLTALAV
jgi:DNA-binding GntR family transcriptional regulator